MSKIHLSHHFVQENKERYLWNAAQRKAFKVTLDPKSGKVILANGTIANGRFIFVYKEGHVYACKEGEKHQRIFGHADLAGGQPVDAAGELLFVDGELKLISNGSGHYKPLPTQMVEGIQGILTSLVPTPLCRSEVVFEDYSNQKETNQKEYFQLSDFLQVAGNVKKLELLSVKDLLGYGHNIIDFFRRSLITRFRSTIFLDGKIDLSKRPMSEFERKRQQSFKDQRPTPLDVGGRSKDFTDVLGFFGVHKKAPKIQEVPVAQYTSELNVSEPASGFNIPEPTYS